MDFKIDISWTLFLDRDGVINERIWGGYVTKPEEFKFLEGVPQAINIFNSLFYKVVVVTNQQGISKKIMTESNLIDLHRYVSEELKKTKAEIHHWFYAKELASDPSNTRKPKPAMAHKAKAMFPEIDFHKSIMVGDTDSDILFGKNLGMKTVRIKTEETINEQADITLSSLYEFAKMLNND